MSDFTRHILSHLSWPLTALVLNIGLIFFIPQLAKFVNLFDSPGRSSIWFSVMSTRDMTLDKLQLPRFLSFFHIK